MYGMTLTLLAIAFASIYFYVQYLYSYWQRRGIPYLKPSFPFGNFGKMLMKRWPLCDQLNEFYRSTAEPFVGVFMLQSPFLLIRDPKLIRSVLITDFQHFTDHPFYLNEKDEPLTANLYALRDQSWRDMRAKLTQGFTPHRMKAIFPTIHDCGNKLQQHLFNANRSDGTIEMSEIIECYVTTAIASTIFGTTDINCLANANHPFRKAARHMFEMNAKNGLRFISMFTNPMLLKWSGLRQMDRSVENYLLNLVAQTLEMREQKNVVRNDFFQFLVESHNDERNTAMKKDKRKSLTFEQVAAQAFGLLMAGMHSSSLAISSCLYEIAKHPDIQRNIHVEIDHVMAQRSGQLSYESINELKYLNCCINETLRKHQVVDFTRVCVKDYKIPGSNVTIEKGTSVIIPTYALAHDEKIHSEPEKFDPARFSTRNKADKSPIDLPHLSFGAGPRNCLGQRMGKLFVEIGVYSILKQYFVELDDQHIGKELKRSINLHPIGGIHLKLKARAKQ